MTKYRSELRQTPAGKECPGLRESLAWLSEMAEYSEGLEAGFCRKTEVLLKKLAREAGYQVPTEY